MQPVGLGEDGGEGKAGDLPKPNASDQEAKPEKLRIQPTPGASSHKAPIKTSLRANADCSGN